MASIAIITAHARFPWLRQIPGGESALEGFRFTIDHVEPDCVALVIYDDPGREFPTNLPASHRMLIGSEPTGIRRYRAGYTAQFGTMMGPVRPLSGETFWLERQPALPWFYGISFTPNGLVADFAIEDLRALPMPVKEPRISVVLSRKSQLPKHRARLAFVEALKAALGERLLVYGRGFTEISDKRVAIAPYAYHLVLENNDIPHFWTEKTADALLGWALPVFSGCANLGTYFPEGSFLPIDLSQPEAAIARITALLDEHPYPRHVPAIRAARERLMGEHNLFPLLAAWARTLPPPRPQATDNIRPSRAFEPFAGVQDAVRSARRRLGLGGKS
jgi:hypothetical protein